MRHSVSSTLKNAQTMRTWERNSSTHDEPDASNRDAVRGAAQDQGANWSFFFLCLFTFAIYARPEDMFPSIGKFHLTLCFGLCAALTYVGALLSRSTDLLWSRELRFTLFLTGWFVAGLPFAFWPGGSFRVFLDPWLKTLIIFFLLTQTLVTLGRVRKLLWAIILSELVVTGFSILMSSSVKWVGDRIYGVSLGILGWNFVGVAIAITLPYIAAILVVERSLIKIALLVATSFTLMWMLVLTASRGGFLNVVLSMTLTSLLVLRDSVRGKIIGVGIILALVMVVALAPGVFWERLNTLWNGSNAPVNWVESAAEESKQERLDLLSRSIQYTLEHPVFGLGLGNFSNVSGTELNQPDAWLGTHNTFTEISSEAGVPALLLFVGVLVTAACNLARIGRARFKSPENLELPLMARAALASLLSFVFAGFFVHLAYTYYFFYTVAIAVGIQQIAQMMWATSATPNFASTMQLSSARSGL
jgi:hypothetical protein